MFNRNTSKFGVLALVSVMLLSLGIGGVAAQTTDTATPTDTDLVGSSVSVTNQTQSVYLDVTGDDDMAGNGPVSVSVTMTGLTEGQDLSNGTELSTSSLSVAAGATESSTYALTDSDISSYDSVHISATVSDANSNIVSADYGTVQKVSGGGGLLDGAGGIGTIPMLGVLAVVGYLVLGND